jgi:hypothetical protein
MSPVLQASTNVKATNSFFYYQGRRPGASQYGADLSCVWTRLKSAAPWSYRPLCSAICAARLSLWIKGATFQQIAAAGFGIATPSGAWRAVHRALVRIPKAEADQARQAQLARLQTIRMLLWNHASADPIRAAEALIKLEAREARLLGLDMPSKLEVTEEGNGIPLEALRALMNRADVEPIDVTPAQEGGRLLTNGKLPEDS